MRHMLFIRATTPLLLLMVVLWSAFWFTPQAHARSLATIVVTDCTDGGLRTAIANAQSGDIITFQCPSNPTTITLGSSLSITKNLTLDGSGQSVTLSGETTKRVLGVNFGVQFTLRALTVADGWALERGGGGGIYNDGGTVTISNSTFVNNDSEDVGGGIYNDGGTVTISNSTFANNQAKNAGAGINNNSGTVTISNSTFVNNDSQNGGGGIYTNGGTVTIGATILAGNGGGNCGQAPGAPITDQGYNLESGTDCGLSGPTDQQNTNPQFQGGLQNNGGPTQTIALQPTSPAVNKIPVNTGHGCITGGTDQRGSPRPDRILLLLPETTCDIGAYEVQDGLLT